MAPEADHAEERDVHMQGESEGEDERPVQRPRLTEADVPPLPKRLGKNATEAEKAARAAVMKERRRVQKQLNEQGRARVRPEAEAERVRRALHRLKAAADRSLLPTATTFYELWALTEEFVNGPPTTPQGMFRRQEKVDAAWERFLGRKMPVAGKLISDEDARFVRPAALPALRQPVHSFASPDALQVCACGEEAEDWTYGGAHGRGVQLSGEWEGEMTLEQGTFENGQLTHGSMYVQCMCGSTTRWT